jgi:imidazolonepropionase-like amidohydrolase
MSSEILIVNAQVWDGASERRFAGHVRVVANRIVQVARGERPPAGNARVIDAAGMTLMPGLVEGHCHLSFVNVATNAELGEIAPEEHTLRTAHNARVLLDHGFTSAFSAASAKPRLDVAVRDAINAGLIPGPRLRAAGPEITVSGGLGDERRLHLYRESFGLIGDGPVAIRQICRTLVREGVDTLKINISGDEFVANARAETTPLDDDELAEVVKVARRFGKMTAAHARSSASVMMAVKHGIDCIYHCDFADEAALDALESVRDRVFVGPAFGLVYNTVHRGEAVGMPRAVAEAMHLPRKFEACVATYQALRKRGLRVVVGGDYGFTVTPFGTNAQDIELFVRFFGYAPHEALHCATGVGAQLMGLGDELGAVREGFLADLLLVRGDVLADVALLQDTGRLAMIMKDGALHKLQPQTMT